MSVYMSVDLSVDPSVDLSVDLLLTCLLTCLLTRLSTRLSTRLLTCLSVVRGCLFALKQITVETCREDRQTMDLVPVRFLFSIQCRVQVIHQCSMELAAMAVQTCMMDQVLLPMDQVLPRIQHRSVCGILCYWFILCYWLCVI